MSNKKEVLFLREEYGEENTLTLMEISMKENGRMGNFMVKGHTLPLMEVSLKGNSRMGYQMVKEH